MPLWGILVFLAYRMRRVNCPRCGVTVEIVPWSDGKNQLTTSYHWLLATWAPRLSWEGNRELAYRLLGNAHEDVLTEFEAYHKAIYKFLVRRLESDPETVKKLCSKKHIGNCFQNIDRGRALYERFNFDPYAALTPDELECLALNIHKRHVLGHNPGMADESYTEVASSAEKVDQNVPVLADEIGRFAAICEAVIVRIEEENPEFLPSTAQALPEVESEGDASGVPHCLERTQVPVRRAWHSPPKRRL